MTLKQYLTTMALATLLGIVSCLFVIINVDPYRSGEVAFLFFYASLFFSLVGIFSIILFFVQRRISRLPLPMFRYVQKAFREAIIVSLFLTFTLYLQGKSWLNVWNGSILLLLFILYLSFSLSLKKNTGPKEQSAADEYTL